VGALLFGFALAVNPDFVVGARLHGLEVVALVGITGYTVVWVRVFVGFTLRLL